MSLTITSFWASAAIALALACVLTGCGSTVRGVTHTERHTLERKQVFAPSGQIVVLTTLTDETTDSEENSTKTYQPPTLAEVVTTAGAAAGPVLQAATGGFPWGEVALGLMSTLTAGVATHQMVKKNQIAAQRDQVTDQRDDVINSVEHAKKVMTDEEWAKVRTAMSAVQAPDTRAAVAAVTA